MGCAHYLSESLRSGYRDRCLCGSVGISWQVHDYTWSSRLLLMQRKGTAGFWLVNWKDFNEYKLYQHIFLDYCDCSLYFMSNFRVGFNALANPQLKKQKSRRNNVWKQHVRRIIYFISMGEALQVFVHIHHFFDSAGCALCSGCIS